MCRMVWRDPTPAELETIEQVTALVNQLFEQDWATRKITGEHATGSSTVIPLHPRNKHLH